ncbi:hypothetical protein BpHYR1_024345 [Brachionus plicatilis]|uniref:Uncharacterized protein n=1 Tax=Brachionus plicatilis TaxID=10195 RepID=A0A3M7RZ76_BRAPC|nr:hypothetical protein BpHYR1_024345 [Brachionus plicatilis]
MNAFRTTEQLPYLIVEFTSNSKSLVLNRGTSNSVAKFCIFHLKKKYQFSVSDNSVNCLVQGACQDKGQNHRKIACLVHQPLFRQCSSLLIVLLMTKAKSLQKAYQLALFCHNCREY